MTENILREECIKLISILREEIALYQIFLEILQKERHIIVNLSLEEIYENNNQKETILLKIRVLEESRLNLIERLADILDTPAAEITISQLCELVWEPYRTELKNCHSTLSALINSIREVNQVNSILIDRFISFLRDSFSLINKLTPSSSFYLSSGEIKEKEENGQILCKKG